MKYKDIDKIYKNIKRRGGIGSVENLRKDCRISRKEALNYLQTQDSYTRHKVRRNKFRRRTVTSPGIDYLWQADIVFLPKYVRENDGNSCLLTVVDVFSKYGFAIPMPSKKSSDVIQAFDSILNSSNRKPKKLECDLGTEFWSAAFQKYVKSKDIHIYNNYSDFGACLVERFNRTICTKISRYLTLIGRKRYIDKLPQILQSYNNTPHSRTKIAPCKVNKYNEMDIWLESHKLLYTKKCAKPLFNLYDRVRIDKTKGIFEKGYWPSFTTELFEICEVIPSIPVTYRIKDMNGEQISGIFYAQDLSRVSSSV